MKLKLNFFMKITINDFIASNIYVVKLTLKIKIKQNQSQKISN